MKFESFHAGHWHPRYQYKSFEPTPVNHAWTWEDPTIHVLLEDATRALAELNAFSLIVPDIDRFIRMHVVKEAQKSSRIEGTQTGIDEAVLSEAHVRPERRDDWREVHNYIDAMSLAIERLATLPLSNRLLCETHAVLMRGVRGEHKRPGEFRISQNWIGGSSLADAAFIPPHHDGVPALMGDLEQFWHNDGMAVPHLIRAAISHYQFETIHPFLDGNGRIGRLLIPLYLISHGVLAKPSLYLSDFFERNRASYYDALMRVRQANDLVHWVRFFLRGLQETAVTGCTVFREILALRAEADQQIDTMGRRSPNGRRLLENLYQQTVVSAADVCVMLQVSKPTAHRLIHDLEQRGLLVEQTGQQRDRLFHFEPYLALFGR